MKIYRSNSYAVDYVGQPPSDDSATDLFPRGYGIRWLEDNRAASFSVSVDGSRHFHVCNRLSSDWPEVDRMTAMAIVFRFEKTGEAIVI